MFSHTIYTLSHQISKAVYQFHDQPALIHYRNYYRRQLCFGEVHKLIRQAACYLEQRGLNKGDRVAIWAANCPEWVVLLGACALMGVIAVPIDATTSERFATSILRKARPHYLFCDRRGFQFDGMQEPLETLFERIAPLAGRPEKSYVVTGTDPLEIIFTSGTTSQPKGVILRHQNLLANIEALRERIVYPEQSRFLSLLPLSHMMEQTIGLLGPLLFGSSIIYTTGRPLPHILEIAKRERVTHMVVVPALLELIRLRIEKQLESASPLAKQWIATTQKFPPFLRDYLLKVVRRDLQAFICGGAALKESTHHFFESFGIPVVCGYGMTEASPVISSQSMSDHPPGQVGMPLPRQFIRIDQDGQILTSGDNVATGYFEDTKSTQEAFTSDGWLKTGDLGILDTQGRLTLLGRSKEMIVTANGLNVFPQDIEALLENHPLITQSVLVKDPLREGSLLAVVRSDRPLLPGELELIRLQANEQLAPHQQIARIEGWEGEFPRTPTLKIKRDLIQQTFLQGLPKTASPRLPKAAQIIAEMAKRPADESLLELHLTRDLGFDSMQTVELWTKLQSQLGQEISPSIFEEDPTIEALCQRLNALKARVTRSYLGGNCHSRFHLALRSLLQPVALKLIQRRWPVAIKGNYPLPSDPVRPIMIIANHTSHLDFVAILSALPPALRKRISVAAARDHFFKGRWALEARLLNTLVAVVGFCRQGDHESNLHLLEQVWDRHHPLLIFPEGTRSRSGQLLPFKRGAAWLAKEFHALIYPIALEGCYDCWNPQERWPKRAERAIDLEWLEPIDSDHYRNWEQLSETMHERIAHALERSRRGGIDSIRKNSPP